MPTTRAAAAGTCALRISGMLCLNAVSTTRCAALARHAAFVHGSLCETCGKDRIRDKEAFAR